MKKLTTLISVVAMMCAVIAALAFSIWAAVYGDSHYGFYKKEYQKYEVTEDLDMNIDHVMYVTEHMMNYLIGKEEKLSVVTTVEGKEQDFFCECKLYRCSHCSATDCRRFKSTYNDRIKCIWDFFKVCKDYNQ